MLLASEKVSAVQAILRERERERPNSHKFYYNILLHFVIVVNLLLCLLYKLNFTIGMYGKKGSIYRVWYYSQFQASTGSLGPHTPWIGGVYCILDLLG